MVADEKRDFGGSIPDYYDRCLGPAWLDGFAQDLAQRLESRPAGDVLEIACGTGLVTRWLRARIDPSCRLVATDISGAMVDYARERLAGVEGIDWREADAAALPFPDQAFGAVVCGFGLMFVPDKAAALGEVRRVLRPGGLFLFNVWDRAEANAHSAAMAATVEDLFPGDPEMRFTLPYELADPDLLHRLLAAGGFDRIEIETARLPAGPVSARTIATGLIHGSPRAALFEARGVPLADAVDRLTAALSEVGGADPYRSSLQALVVKARSSG